VGFIEGNEVTMSYICARCIADPELSVLVAANAREHNVCDYCEYDRPAVDLDFVAQQCSDVIETFYENSSRTMAVIHFDRTPAGQDLQSLLNHLVGAPDDAIEALEEALQQIWHDSESDEPIYGEDPWFVPRLGFVSTEFHSGWHDMEVSLRNEARYSNPKAIVFLDTVFEDMDLDVTPEGLSVLTKAVADSPYDRLYRARVFQSEEDMRKALEHPERNLGAPPAGVAKSGRMNARGQPAFYGAMSVKTALAEVRPPVGSWVVVARFALIRPLQLLNLGLFSQLRLPSQANLFDPYSKKLFQRYAFLRHLSTRLVQPVMPESEEHNYLMTQVIADYLAMHPRIELDGIIYPSVQRGVGERDSQGDNVVLFHKAATCIGADAAASTADADLYDYDDARYDSRDPVRRLEPTIIYKKEAPRLPAFQHFSNARPAPGLTLIRDSIEIHRIIAVDIQTDPIVVHVSER
jgi:DNA-directed RNA polymerase subunit RPC12/RpoP